MARIGVTALLAGSMMACAQPAPPPAKPPVPRQSSPAPEPPPPIPDYVPGARSPVSSYLVPRHPGDDGGVLIGGERVSLDGKLAPDTGVDGLVGGRRVKKAWGGGFLFWTYNALFHAPTFSGPLTLVAPLASQVSALSYGPGFLLVRTTEGHRFTVNAITHAVAPPSPLGLVDVAAMPDGPAVALLEDGRAMLSMNQGKTWRAVDDFDAAPVALSVVGDRVWLELQTGARRLERDGTWSAFQHKPSLPEPQQPPSECGAEFARDALLDAAVQFGLPLEEGIALAPLKGALVQVDLRTGRCLAEPIRIAPGRSKCDLVDAKSGPLAVCSVRSRGAIVFSDLLKDWPKQEASFEGDVHVHEAGGNLIVDGPCSGVNRTSGVVCIRDEKGEYREFDRRDERWSGWISRWIPKDTGGAVGLTLEPEPAWIDAVTGKRTKLKIDASVLRNLLRRRSRVVIDRAWHVTADGLAHGWRHRRHVTLGPDGLKTSPFELASFATHGPRAFGFDRTGHAWQTLDDGENWTAVLAPPSYHTQSRPNLKQCSAVGCDLQGWLRIGWRTTPPEPRRPSLPRTPSPALAFQRGELACQRTGPVDFASFPPPQDTARETSMFGFGARIDVEERGEVRYVGAEFMLGAGRYPGDDLALRAFSHQRDVSVDSGSWAGVFRTVWHTMPFEPAPKARRMRFSLREIAAGAPGNVDLRQWMTASQRGASLPVLAGKGKTAGFVLTTPGTSPLLWVGGPAARGRVLAPGLEDLDSTPLSVATQAKDELLVLGGNGSCASQVLKLGTRASQRLWSLPERPRGVGCPPNRDVLALGPDGKVGVLRTPSGHQPPSAKDPALLLRTGRPATALAPWSTLKTASDPACKQDTSGWNAIVVTDDTWLGVSENGKLVTEYNGMLALVSWSSQRVCLHAVEVDAGTFMPAERNLRTTIVARFGDTPVAGRVGIGRGEQVRIPMECALRAP